MKEITKTVNTKNDLNARSERRKETQVSTIKVKGITKANKTRSLKLSKDEKLSEKGTANGLTESAVFKNR